MMRVFQVIEASANARVAANQTWRRNLYEPLVDMGVQVTLFPAEEGRKAADQKSPALRAAFSQKLLDTFRREQAERGFDLVFTYLMDGMVEPAALDELHRSGAPVCNFSCNNIHQFDLVDEISPHVDFSLHAERDARPKFLAIGANPLWWPMASNPKYFKPYPLERSVPVSFVGANYALRARFIHYLLSHGIEVHAYGPGWQHGTTSAWRSQAKRVKYLLHSIFSSSAEAQYRASANLADHDFRRLLAQLYPNNMHPPVSDEELVLLYSRSQVSLGFLEVYEGHDASRPVTRHVHLREFEAPMSGALYCTGYSDELAGYFEPDREILVYRTEEELYEKACYYLAHPQEAEAIRQAGRQRALHDHTYRRRFEQLFAVLGLHL
jgi:spore maturation protein CgeB